MLMTGKRSITKAAYKRTFDPESRRKQRKLNTRQKGEVKRIVRFGRELKFFNRQVGPLQSIGIGASIIDLSNMVQGNRDTERNGDRIELAGSMDVILQVVGAETVALANADIYNTLRIVFFQYKDSAVSGVNPLPAQIFLTGPSGVVDVHSLYNHDERQNYTILYDKTVTCVNNTNPPGTGTNYQGNHVHNYKFKVSLKRAKKLVQYVGAGTDGTNKIYFYIVSDSAVAPNPSYTLNCKLFYRDS